MELRTLGAGAAIVSQLAACAAFAACPVVKTYQVPDKVHGFDKPVMREVRETPDFVVFRSGLRVNTDGAADSYHPIGTSKGARNTICNGIAVYPASGPYKGQRVTSIAPKSMTEAERCQLILDIFRDSMNAGYAIPNSGRIDWYALAMEPGTPPAGFYRPCIQKEGDPKPGFFVAQTAVAADGSKNMCDPARWMDSTTIPYVTLPSGSPTFKSAGVKAGDLALVHRVVNGGDRWVTAIVGDSGNKSELGEGSLALHAALGSPQKSKPFSNLPADVTTFIFKNSKPTGAISAATLNANTPSLVAKLGGNLAKNDCLK